MKISDHKDNFGNTLRVEKYGQINVIKLLLPKQRETRRIGLIDKPKRVFRTERIKRKHYHRKRKSYAFNDYLLTYCQLFDTVELKEGKNFYLIPVKFILDNGVRYAYEAQGFEQQIFISLKLIEQFKK